MFRNVPGCSGMFRNVPCSGFYWRPTKNVIPCLRQQAIYPVDSLTQNFRTCLGQRGKKTILAHPLIDQKWEFPQGSSICNSALDQVIHDIFQRFINQKGVIWPQGYSWEFFVGECHPVLQILTLFQTKNVISHTCFHTCKPLKSITIFRPGFKSSLLRLEHHQIS